MKIQYDTKKWKEQDANTSLTEIVRVSYNPGQKHAPFYELKNTGNPTTIEYILDKCNPSHMNLIAKESEKRLDCKDLVIRRDDNMDRDHYLMIVQDFINIYKGNLNIHISSKGTRLEKDLYLKNLTPETGYNQERSHINKTISQAMTEDGVLDLRKLQEIEGLYGYNGGQGCDVLEGPCSCGAWH